MWEQQQPVEPFAPLLQGTKNPANELKEQDLLHQAIHAEIRRHCACDSILLEQLDAAKKKRRDDIEQVLAPAIHHPTSEYTQLIHFYSHIPGDGQ